MWPRSSSQSRAETSAEICRKLGVTKTTFYRWNAKYGGLGADDAKRLQQLEDENRRLKKIVADQTLDMQILKEVLGPRRAPKRNCPGRRSGRGSFILRRVLVTSRALSRCRTKRCGACART